MQAMNKVAFFDRDGTINVNTGHLYEAEKLIFVPGVPELIRHYNENGYLVIVVTNQAGIAKGYYTQEQMQALHCVMNERLKKEYGAHIDAFYFCPHHPDFTGPCYCRKPETGMLEQAIRDYDIDPKQSILFGDKPSDMECAKRMGIEARYIQNELGLTEKWQWDRTELEKNDGRP